MAVKPVSFLAVVRQEQKTLREELLKEKRLAEWETLRLHCSDPLEFVQYVRNVYTVPHQGHAKETRLSHALYQLFTMQQYRRIQFSMIAIFSPLDNPFNDVEVLEHIE